MSGERVVLVDDFRGSTSRLVEVIGRLADAELGSHALIGGLAVMCRLAAVHRATLDVDTVTESTTPTAIEVIVSSIGVRDPSNPSRALVNGVKVDVIDTQAFRYEDLNGVVASDRLFVVSHRWALDTAEEAQIVVGDVAGSIRVATPAALVATKSGAVLGGRAREPRKRASDLYDLYRLTLEHDRTGGVAESLMAAPFGLGRLVSDALRASVLVEPERAIRWLVDGGPEATTVTADDLVDVIGPLVGRITR